MEQTETFGSFLGFKINNKTKIITKFLTEQEEDNVKTITDCDLAINGIKYLGINSSGKMEYYSKIIMMYMERQSKLKLLWFGKISATKMNILRKINFLFQMLQSLCKTKS